MAERKLGPADNPPIQGGRQQCNTIMLSTGPSSPGRVPACGTGHPHRLTVSGRPPQGLGLVITAKILKSVDARTACLAGCRWLLDDLQVTGDLPTILDAQNAVIGRAEHLAGRSDDEILAGSQSTLHGAGNVCLFHLSLAA